MATYNGRRGHWMVFGYDVGPYIVSVHEEASDAIATSESYHNIGFWPVGMSFSDAVNDWQQRGASPKESPPTAPSSEARIIPVGLSIQMSRDEEDLDSVPLPFEMDFEDETAWVYIPKKEILKVLGLR